MPDGACVLGARMGCVRRQGGWRGRQADNVTSQATDQRAAPLGGRFMGCGFECALPALEAAAESTFMWALGT